jgi:uncharacterized protein (DUF2235 family)
VVSSSLSHTSRLDRLRSWYLKAKDSAVGSSFDQHVVGGYRFLMRFYSPGDSIFIFGFSRGAYIARFLAEMLDYVGLLSHGNEEMVAFAWKAFSQWQCRRSSKTEEGVSKTKHMYEFMKGFRETFSRPVRRIRFLGLFDTVNSVPRFETAWMERSKFPYTAHSTAKVIRHAVSIDERRAKFRQDLIYQSADRNKQNGAGHVREKMHNETNGKYTTRKQRPVVQVTKATQPQGDEGRGRQRLGDSLAVPEADPAPYRSRSRSTRTRSRSAVTTRSSVADSFVTGAADTMSDISNSHLPRRSDDRADMEDLASNADSESSEDEAEQDIDEVWFAGGHGDVGGGWEIIPGGRAASHVPLVWMVREAMKAGLSFDEEKVVAMGCQEAMDNAQDVNQHPNGQNGGGGGAPLPPEIAVSDAGAVLEGSEQQNPGVPDITIRSPSIPSATLSTTPITDANKSGLDTGKPPATFKEMMHAAHVARIHDSLSLSCGMGLMSVLSWKMMEYMPFRRLDLRADGTWRSIRWPLPCGEVRDVPDNARVHGSVIRRMQMDASYRPGNLIVGGGGRGCRVAPKEHGMGEWKCVAEEGDPVGEIWVKKSKDTA